MPSPRPSSPDRSHPLFPTPRRQAPRRDHLLRGDPSGSGRARQARFLDPSTAPRFEHEHLLPTAYAGDQLLVRPGPDDAGVRDRLREAATQEGYDATEDPRDEELVTLARERGVPLGADNPLVVRWHLRRRQTGRPLPPPDAFEVLQRYREVTGRGPGREAVQLEHLLTTAALDPAPYVAHPYVAHPYVAHPYVAHPYVAHPYVAHGGGDPYAPPPGSATLEYAQPGWGGRMPVTWLGPAPARRGDGDLGGARRPVVAVLDTGCGTHPWLPDTVVDRAPRCGRLRIGLTDPDTDIERLGVLGDGLTGSLDIEAGHGTFITGLVHQRCPDARILAVRVVEPDGVVSEYEVLRALNMIWLRQEVALLEGDRHALVDVVSLSLGYYHEQPTDAAFDPLMLATLHALGRRGVVVVTSAGNDATSRPLYPAAFAPYPGGRVPRARWDEVPVTAVGALNPDGSVALFSNDGPWVRAYRPGAGLVSTMPTTFAGGRQPSSATTVGGVTRTTIDPDDFGSGFATWSGTSFAAPVLAGDVAACLNEARVLHADPGTPEDAVRAGWAALRRAVPDLEEPA